MFIAVVCFKKLSLNLLGLVLAFGNTNRAIPLGCEGVAVWPQ